MAEKQSKDLRPVKLLGLQDEMYPRFNFLKERLLSIYPRFKTVIEKEKLDELVTDGKLLIKTLRDHVDPLKDTVEIILMGSHEVIKERKSWNSFVASTRCRFGDDEKLTTQSLAGDVFEIDDVKKIAARPGVIVYIVSSEENSKQAFEEVKIKMCNRMPVDGHKSLILCSDKLENYITLQDYIQGRLYDSTNNTLGQLIQECLEEKVVAVLQEIVNFIQRGISPQVGLSEFERGEPLKQAVSMTFGQVINKIKGGDDVESIEMQILYDKIEHQTCKNISQRYGVNENLIKNMYKKATLGEIFKQTLKRIQAGKEGNRWEECIDIIEKHLRGFDRKSLELFEKLSTLDFEIKGVFRQADFRVETKDVIQQANYPVSLYPDISKNVQERILRISDVYGCGVMLGKLVVHLEEYSPADIEVVTKEVIRIIMESSASQYFANHLEVKRIRLSLNASGHYESGQWLRVKNSAGHANPYTYGTLGCFVKGKHIIDSNEKLYALSCAHVFPDGCHPVVKISRAHPPSNWEIIGNFIPEFKLRRELHVDIAAIALTVAEQKLNHCLKNSHGSDKWRSTLHEGDIKDILGFQVYKWGPVSNCTRGLISSVNYLSRDFNSELNVFIKTQTETPEKFSSEGDSGSVVCFDAPTDETVEVVSLLNGEMTVTTTESQEFSYSIHLKKNLVKLSEQSDHSFELYNLDQ